MQWHICCHVDAAPGLAERVSGDADQTDGRADGPPSDGRADDPQTDRGG